MPYQLDAESAAYHCWEEDVLLVSTSKVIKDTILRALSHILQSPASFRPRVVMMGDEYRIYRIPANARRKMPAFLIVYTIKERYVVPILIRDAASIVDDDTTTELGESRGVDHAPPEPLNDAIFRALLRIATYCWH